MISACTPSHWQPLTYLLDTGAIIPLKATINPPGGRVNVSQLLSIHVLRFCAHSRDCEELFIFLYTLLELPEENAKS